MMEDSFDVYYVPLACTLRKGNHKNFKSVVFGLFVWSTVWYPQFWVGAIIMWQVYVSVCLLSLLCRLMLLGIQQEVSADTARKS